MPANLPDREIVLLGVGHTNAHVLRMWGMEPIPGARLTCISNFATATYSGMLPGVLAGQYPPERMEIDLVRLAAASGARLLLDPVEGLDLDRGRIRFATRPDLPFDALVIGTGSVPDLQGVCGQDDCLLTIKPMQTFLDRLTGRLTRLAETLAGNSPRIAIVGGGAGGVEMAFCLPRFLGRWPRLGTPRLTLIQHASRVASGSPPAIQQRLEGLLAERGVRLELGARATGVAEGQVQLEDGRRLAADLVIWATGAVAPPLLSQLGLETDERGFIRTRATLQTLRHPAVFAVGDSGAIEGQPLPKAGVYAVRQGPILWSNLQRLLAGQRLLAYRPQRDFLKLVNTGDGRALAEYRGWSWHARWCWRWKDSIDSRFMDRYQNYSPRMAAGSPMALEQSPPGVVGVGGDADRGAGEQMRCLGCGGKLAGDVLGSVLNRLELRRHPRVLVGLDAPDDAAVLLPSPHPLSLTADFFAAPVDDGYLCGRLAALNALSDIAAMGGTPLAAIALVTLPWGSAAAQEQLLFELLSGSLHEFERLGVSLVGGHTIEGPRLTVGFTVVADQPQGTLTKGQMAAGDSLLLTKPLGCGLLLAAHMLAACKADWMQTLVTSMLQCNQATMQLASAETIHAATDVSGFGLAGHLLEMLRGSNVAAELELTSIPLLPGVRSLAESGLESTLAPANRSAEAEIAADSTARLSAEYRALFDPQTCGGLLLSMAPEDAGELQQRLRQQGLQASIIGHVLNSQEGAPRIRVIATS